MVMELNVLNSVKSNVGIPEDVADFDNDIILYTNLALDTLIQLGVDVATNIDKDTEWTNVISNIPQERISIVQSYVNISVRLIFDPPSNSTILNSLKNKINELEFRLQVKEE